MKLMRGLQTRYQIHNREDNRFLKIGARVIEINPMSYEVQLGKIQGETMKNLIRITVVMVIFLSGVLLVPAMGLPTQGFNWQRYANVYDQASLEINHESGAPGSFFSISGSNFSSKTMVNIYANGVLLGNLETSEFGDLLFLIDSTGAGDGYYLIQVQGTETAGTKLLVDTTGTLWSQEDEGTVFSLNAPGLVPFELLFMPLIEQ